MYEQQHEYAHSGEIGYWLSKEFWGQGIATQAVKDFCDTLFSSTPIMRLFAPVFAPNAGSKRVLEKAGFDLEGVCKRAIYKDGVYFDEYRYAMLAPEN